MLFSLKLIMASAVYFLMDQVNIKKHRGSQGLQASDFVVLFGFLMKYCVKILLLVFLLNCTFVW